MCITASVHGTGVQVHSFMLNPFNAPACTFLGLEDANSTFLGLEDANSTFLGLEDANSTFSAPITSTFIVSMYVFQ